jgi:signal peptidase I
MKIFTWLKRHPRTILLAGLTALLLLPSYLRAYTLSGASAAPTVVLGDVFIVNNAAYDLRLPYSHITLVHTGSIRRGDVVFVGLPIHVAAIKRVMGLPGETIEVRENRVIVDGRTLPSQPVDADFAWVSPQHHMGSTVFMEDGHWCAYTPGKGESRNFAPIHLRAGEYFLMGDNRDNSLDSRAFGPVSRDKITGKMIAVFEHTARLRTNQ